MLRSFWPKHTLDAKKARQEAINRILKHYEGYIAVLSTRKLYDEYGNVVEPETNWWHKLEE